MRICKEIEIRLISSSRMKGAYNVLEWLDFDGFSLFTSIPFALAGELSRYTTRQTSKIFEEKLLTTVALCKIVSPLSK